MDRIVSFEDFRKKSTEIAEDAHVESTEKTNEDGEKQYYMFFQNLASIKHYIDEISKMSPDDVDALLKSGHDWAADHLATSKDDIQEVAEWLRGEMEDAENQGAEHGEDHEEMIEPENVIVDVEGNGDETVEVEDDEKKGEEEEEDNEEGEDE